MFTIGHEEIQVILGQLDQAINNHNTWYENITRTLICRLPHDQRDVREDAHRECQFGQWYYGNTIESLTKHPSFAAIEQEHAHMHQLAAKLLLNTAHDAPIDVIDFDHFANSIGRLRLQITSLRRELQDSLFNRDPLTGARNRIGMLTHLREQHALIKRKAHQSCIAIMDLDHFKHINDEYGHQSGDKVLKEVAGYALRNIRPYDILFRYGGEEFLLCMPQTNIQFAITLVDRLRDGIEKLEIEIGSKSPLHITVSFGVAPLDPDIYVEDSIHRADQALYGAKEQGRNRVVIWEDDLED